MNRDDARPTGVGTSDLRTVIWDGFRRRGWDYVAIVVALAFLSVAWPTFFVTHDLWPVLVPVLAVLCSLPVAVVRHTPFVSWGVVVVACLVAVPFRVEPGYPLGWPVVFHLTLAVCLAAVILVETPPRVATAIAATMVLMAFGPQVRVSVGWMVGVAVFSAVVLIVRWLVSSRRQLRSSHAQLARESERSSEQSDLRVMAEERNHLARDLHDVVAHQMSMIVVQSQSAPYRLQGVTPGIHAEFDSIAGTAREALDEVRGLLGVLRTDAESGAVEPVGVDQIEPTLQSARRSGVDITWQITGATDQIDETAGVVLHRVLQESLSNASRHAPGGLVVVTLTVASVDSGDARATAMLEVDSGPAAPGALISPGSGGGSGIKGMSARVQAVGGTFAALPAADGGFTVSATVPIRTGKRTRSRLG
ncbi:sensor histidine kinase [Dietzia sp. PP-33]|uniref:sensor histidine kinase n=1 Tax=Dietzia sp. PP-33 TaxID=2957500 RepID=UPI0029A1F14A|nr:histidine kinase [Dietzia sp. PP-33]MDX2357222.1 histidine kinase [Dietzia sp. PP-33]